MSALSPAELERLQGLHDIVLPMAPGVWPLAPGMWLLVLLLALLVVRAGQSLWHGWRRNAYRRQALRALRALRADPALSAQAQLTDALRILHTALRSLEPAAGDWRALLQARLPVACPERLLAEAPYWPSLRVSADEADHVIDYAERWLREHRGHA